MAPILSFTAEEIWQQLPAGAQRQDSVHLELFPPATGASHDPQRWRALLALREEVARVLEAARRDKTIGSGLESRVTLSGRPGPFAAEFGQDWDAFLEAALPDLPGLLIVSEVAAAGTMAAGSVIVGEGPLAGLGIAVERHPGVKCPRCWTFVPALGSAADFPEVCSRCAPKLAAGLAAGAWPDATQAG
jgi:isoleucyl-tRNA synthetase